MRAFYSDNADHALRVLRHRIATGDLTGGKVDDRDIRELPAEDLAGFERLHFFAGIGGWELALQAAAWPPHHPVWTGSCPCQPFSSAGRRRAFDDPRHLWPVWAGLIEQCQPPVIFGEQVASKDGRAWLSRVRADLEAMGYAVGAADLPAASLGAPHIRQRLWWVADRGCGGVQRRGGSGPALPAAGSHEDPRCDGRHGGLADPISGRCRSPVPEHAGHSPQRAGAQSTTGRVADPAQECGDGGGHTRGRRDEHPDGCRASWLGLAAQQQVGDAGQSRRQPETPWSDFSLIWCADGVYRRFEPGTLPLADGVPGRVGQIRGYGNGIVVPLAAEFVAAYMEARQIEPQMNAGDHGMWEAT